MHRIDHFETRSEKCIRLAGNGHKIGFRWLMVVNFLIIWTIFEEIVSFWHFDGEVALNPSLIFRFANLIT